MEKHQKSTVIRFAIIFLLVVIGFASVVVQTLIIQTKEREQWQKLGKRHEPILRRTAPMRGNIYDCNGQLLTGSLPRYDLVMDMRAASLRKDNGKLLKENIDSIAIGLHQILGERSVEGYKQLLQEGFRTKKGRLYLTKKSATYTQMREVMQLPLFCLNNSYKSGLLVESKPRRAPRR